MSRYRLDSRGTTHPTVNPVEMESNVENANLRYIGSSTLLDMPKAVARKWTEGSTKCKDNLEVSIVDLQRQLFLYTVEIKAGTG